MRSSSARSVVDDTKTNINIRGTTAAAAVDEQERHCIRSGSKQTLGEIINKRFIIICCGAGAARHATRDDVLRSASMLRESHAAHVAGGSFDEAATGASSLLVNSTNGYAAAYSHTHRRAFALVHAHAQVWTVAMLFVRAYAASVLISV